MPGPWREPEGEKFALGSLDEQAHWSREYERIIDDARARSQAARSDDDNAGAGTVGLRLPRKDVLYKVRGKARYAANVALEGTLHGRFVRSPHPHARIVRIDTAAAERSPGVAAVLTASEIPDDRLLVGTIVDDTPILARDKVRYVGEAVVAIVAETEQQAEAACLLVEVDYEPLEAVVTPEDALRPGAPQIDPAGNVIVDLKHGRGDIDAGFAEADVVLENTYETEPVDHCFLEAPSCVAFVDPDDVLTVLVCTQYPHYHHRQLARVTGRPMERVRVVQSVVGGGFGGKMDNTVECASALLTLKTGRPIQMTYTREEVFIATTKRHAMKIRQRIGATRDGRITALDVENMFDGGAYRSYSPICSGRCVIHAGMPYRIPNLRVRHTTVFTNHVPSGAMRSFGVVKVAFGMESQINELADRLGMSPVEIRRINGLVDGDRTSTGQEIWDVGLLKSLDAIDPIFEERKRDIAANPLRDGRRRGVGIACLGYGIGYSGVRNPSTARVRANADGVVTALCGTPDIGTGSDMSLAQVAAQAAGVSVARVEVISGDSTRTDDSGPTSASRTTYFSGNAALLAGEDFRRQFENAVSRALDVPREEVRLENDIVVARNQRMSFRDACRLIADRIDDIVGYGKFDPDIAVDILTFKGNPYPTYVFATHLVEVEVDEDLGTVDLVRCWAAHDAGTIVNPIGAEGQVEGGVAMGLGQALWERVVRRDGVILNPHYRDYLLPGSRDVTMEINTIFVEGKDRTGPYGAKGVAEVSLIPIPAALASAVHHAVGVRPDHLPFDAEYLFRRLGARQAAE
jgi:CO/xanthine dehydrogenase Mo-binding subunit